MPVKFPPVTIIVVNFNGKKYLPDLFTSLIKLNYPLAKIEVILIDNLSTDNSPQLVKEYYPKAKIIRNNVNSYCKALNMGIRAAKYDYVALVNNDIKFDKNWLAELVKVISKDKNIAVAGSKILDVSGKIQHAGHCELPDFYWGDRGAGKPRSAYNRIEDVVSLSGAAVLYRKAVFFEAGLFDEDFVIYGEDVDMSFRIKQKGYRVVFVPGSVAYHKFHGTATEDLARYYIERNRLLFLAKHYPEKLSGSLIGNGYFTAKNSSVSAGKIYSLLPGIIMKLFQSHPPETARDTVSDLIKEINRIANYENELLAKEINKITDDRNNTYAMREGLLRQIRQMADELGRKEKEFSGKDALINKLQGEVKGFLDALGKNDSLLQEAALERGRLLEEKQKEAKAHNDEIALLTAQLRQRTDAVIDRDKLLSDKTAELLNKDAQIAAIRQEKDVRIAAIMQELKQALASLQEKADARADKLKNEIKDLLVALGEKDSLLKDAASENSRRLEEKSEEIRACNDKILLLTAQLRQRADAAIVKEKEVSAKDQLLEEKEREIKAYSDEIALLTAQLRQRMDASLIKESLLIEKDDQLLGKDAEITAIRQELEQALVSIRQKVGELSQKEEAISIKDRLLEEKEREARAYSDEIALLAAQLRQRVDAAIIKDNLLIEKDSCLSIFKSEMGTLSNQLHKKTEELFAKDNQLIEKRIEADVMREELSTLAGRLAELSVAAEGMENKVREKENELVAYKDELINLSHQLRQRLDEALIRDGQAIEKDALMNKLQEELRYHAAVIREKEAAIHAKENDLARLKNELCHLSGQLSYQAENAARQKEELINQFNQQIKYADGQKQELLNQLNLQIEDSNYHKNQLNGIYGSEGYRFVLRPLWATISSCRSIFSYLHKKIENVFWMAVAFLVTPAYIILSLCFAIEYLAWAVFKPLLKLTAARRRSALPADPRVSVVIPNYNGVEFLKECLPSLFAADGFSESDPNEVLIVDDGSVDDSVSFIRSNFPRVRLLRNKKNRGFGFTCNRGIRAAKNEIVLLINNDIILTKDFLKPLLGHLQRNDVFTVTPKLYAWDRQTFVWGMHIGHFENGYIRLWNESETGNGSRIDQPSPSIFAIGGAMVFRKNDFLWLGGFDEIYRPNCWEDIDISYRAWKRGLEVIYEPSSVMYHKGRATLTYERPKEIKNELLFTWKNITDGRILRNHINLLPYNLYRHRKPFLKGFFWALNYFPQAMLHRFLERRFIVEPKDGKIFDKITLYYENFVKRGFRHLGNGKPNVLMVSRFFPYPLKAGGKIRIHSLIKGLSDRYNFYLLSIIDHYNELELIPELKKVFVDVFPVHARSPKNVDFSAQPFYPERYKNAYSYNEGLIDKLKEVQDAIPIDVIHIESNELLYLNDYVRRIPVVYTEHDISILTMRQSYYKSVYGHLGSFFDHLKRTYFHYCQLKKIDKIITLSREDEADLHTFFPKGDITLLPTGVDLKHFVFDAQPKKTKKLVFIGHYRHYPNEDAAAYFVEKILPLIRKKVPSVEFLIVGSSPTPHVKELAKQKNVTLVGEVDDVQPYLAESSVFVNSIRVSAGIKGKVLEAMSAGVPVVSTTAGSSGIDARDGEEILIADTPRKFAAYVIRLLNEDTLRLKVATNARKLVENKYNWREICDKLDSLYKNLFFEYDKNRLRADAVVIDEVIDRTKRYIEERIERANGRLTKTGAGPEELHIELTYNCNSKCIMCDLWDYHRRLGGSNNPELSLEEIRRIVGDSQLLQRINTVVFSGGEPFLRADIGELCGLFAGQLPDCSIGMLTNGLYTERIISKTKEVLDRYHPRKLWLGSSLDGVGKDHDRIRGTDGAFAALQNTISRAKKELPGVELSVTFTLTPYNVDQLLPAKQFADSEGLNFFAQFVVPKDARESFVWKPADFELADWGIKQIIHDAINKSGENIFSSPIDKVRNKGLLAQIYYWSHLVKYQTSPQRFFKKCVSGSKFAMLNPYGELFFCPTHKHSCIGNVREKNFDQLWRSERAEHMRDFIRGNNCHCWLVCIVFPVLDKVLND